MEDFDIFTDEINYTKPVYKNTLNKLVYDGPSTPRPSNYQSGMKLLAEEALAENNDAQCTFMLSEAVSASIRVMAVYREEQRALAADNKRKITEFIKPVQQLAEENYFLTSKEKEHLSCLLPTDEEFNLKNLENLQIEEELPFHRRYLKFSNENNIDNFYKILKELPKEWTIIQLTSPYNPNENFKSLADYQKEIDAIYLSIFTNDYLDECGLDPLTLYIPANVTKEGIKPLFTELYSILEENYKTIENAQFLNNKKLVQNYWARREDIDLRMKSAITTMDKQWLGGWGCLLTGRLVDGDLRHMVKEAVDKAVEDWGFIRLTTKQKFLLYNLLESCSNMTSQQIKSCIRRILTEHGNIRDVREVLEPCENCTKDFKLIHEVCLKCLSSCFKRLHNFSLVDGISAFSQVATLIKDGDQFAALKKAERHPVILIVDEILDTFPWETLPILNHHPVSRIDNIHFLYYLFKIHQPDVVNGYFVTKGHEGRYVINPERNLDRMERRMRSFVQYWCGAWSGTVAEPPPPQAFLHYLNTAHIFLYCGHGDGCQFANGPGSGVESSSSARAVCVLSGCGSARLVYSDNSCRSPPSAAHRRLHIAGSPCVVGMLWEVTDLEVDKVVSTLLALAVPSAAGVPWAAVGKAGWSQGQLDINTEQKSQFTPEPDLLRAIVRSRGSSNFAMIASSVVARGLPVKIR